MQCSMCGKVVNLNRSINGQKLHYADCPRATGAAYQPRPEFNSENYLAAHDPGYAVKHMAGDD